MNASELANVADDDGEAVLGLWDLQTGAAWFAANELAKNWQFDLGTGLFKLLRDIEGVKAALTSWERRLRVVFLGETEVDVAVRRAVRLQHQLNDCLRYIETMAVVGPLSWLREDLEMILITEESEDAATRELLETITDYVISRGKE